MNEIQNIEEFNYSQLDNPTIEYLKIKESIVKNIIGKTAENLGKELSEAQEKLSGNNQYNGIFEKWYTSLGFKKQTVYNYINYYNLLVQQLDNQNLIEDLPKPVAYAIANPNVSQELKEAVLSGDVKTSKEFKQLEKEKKKLEKEREEFKNLANEKSEEAKKMFDDKMKAESDRLLTDKVLRETQAEFKALQAALQKEKDSSKKTIEQLEKNIKETKQQLLDAGASGNDEEVQRLNASLQEMQTDLDSSAQKIDELEAELKNKAIDVITAEPVIIEKVPDEVTKELEELRKKSSPLVAKFKGNHLMINQLFIGQLQVIAEAKETDPENYENFKRNTLNMINKISEQL